MNIRMNTRTMLLVTALSTGLVGMPAIAQTGPGTQQTGTTQSRNLPASPDNLKPTSPGTQNPNARDMQGANRSTQQTGTTQSRNLPASPDNLKPTSPGTQNPNAQTMQDKRPGTQQTGTSQARNLPNSPGKKAK